jgi:hypothetical protein
LKMCLRGKPLKTVFHETFYNITKQNSYQDKGKNKRWLPFENCYKFMHDAVHKHKISKISEHSGFLPTI